jgi:hypothetical protein
LKNGCSLESVDEESEDVRLADDNNDLSLGVLASRPSKLQESSSERSLSVVQLAGVTLGGDDTLWDTGSGSLRARAL